MKAERAAKKTSYRLNSNNSKKKENLVKPNGTRDYRMLKMTRTKRPKQSQIEHFLMGEPSEREPDHYSV